MKMKTDMMLHGEHSRMVRAWNPTHKALPFGDMPREGATHALRSPASGYVVQVRFTELPERPDEMIVRSTNWRAEHEPNGVFTKSVCRAFYQQLKAAGFVED
jgi:hypothetical protein